MVYLLAINKKEKNIEKHKNLLNKWMNKEKLFLKIN